MSCYSSLCYTGTGIIDFTISGRSKSILCFLNVTCALSVVLVVSGVFGRHVTVVKMNTWPTDQRVFCVEQFIKNNSVIQVQRDFRRTFDVRNVPSRPTILCWVQKWRTQGSVANAKHSGRPLSACTPENQLRVQQAVTASPTRSVTQHAQALNLSDRSIRRMLHKMSFHPYKIALVQQLSDQDKQQRIGFCRTFLQLRNDHPEIEHNLFMSDEAHFYLDGFVNKQNCRHWATENPHELHQRPLHSLKVTVWCAVSSTRIIGPYFFEVNGQAVTVTSDRYADMLTNFFEPQLHDDERQHWFQQDGATSHTADVSLAVCRRIFPGHLISRRGDINWPARSPDLTAPDYFLWGFLKSRVYCRKPRNIEELKEAIRLEVREIPHIMLQRVMANFIKRLEECIEMGGGHLTRSIFS